MKLMILLMVPCIFYGQTTGEWLNQKETQRKYLQQQVAALRTYIDYAKKGYSIAKMGLTKVRDIKEGDFNLHNDFLNSFQRVNPAIKSYSKVADIIALQLNITAKMKDVLNGLQETKMFSTGELDYCSGVIKNLLNSCAENMEELIMVISEGKLDSDSYRMSDAERLKRIDALYADMQDKAAFCSSFSGDMALLTVQRIREFQDVKISKILNGIK